MSAADSLSVENPYRSPGVGAPADADPNAARRAEYEQLGRVFVTWEKLRLLFNLIGAMPTLLIAATMPERIYELAECAVVANLAFCAGPLVDGYLTWLGLRSKAITAVLFILGTLAMLGLAALAAMAWSFNPGIQ